MKNIKALTKKKVGIQLSIFTHCILLSIYGLIVPANAFERVSIGEGYYFDVNSSGGGAANLSSPLALKSATVLAQTEHYKALRQGTFFVTQLLTPHLVLSTSAFNGGQLRDIKYLVNHQSMEAKGDNTRFFAQLAKTREQYHQTIASKLGVKPNELALMGTAANIQQLAKAEHSFQDLTVTVFATAGVKGNAQRAGDDTRWFQVQESGRVVNKSVNSIKSTDKNSVPSLKESRPIDNKGTINIIVLVNQAVTPGAQTKIAMLTTEAKSAALAELSIFSKQSSHLATGTGTDQIIVATPIATASDKKVPLPSASGHLKLGELIGVTVKEAVLEALRWQNELEPSQTSSVFHALSRFGLNEAYLLSQLEQHLSQEEFKLAKQNLASVSRDARLVASAYAFANLLDKLQYGALPKAIVREATRDQASQAAVAVSAKPELWSEFWQLLSFPKQNIANAETKATHSNKVTSESQAQLFKESIALFTKAIALGWQHKWLDE